MTQTLEKSPSTSPLLSDAVIERDYTQGIETQLGQPKQQPQREQAPPPPPPGEKQQSQQQPPPGPDQQQNFQFDAPGDFEPPKGFQFEEEQEDPSDVGMDEDSSQFQLAASSAKAFANMTGDVLKVYIPKAGFAYCAIDKNNIEAHINSGNIHPNAREAVENINNNILEALQLEDDSLKMWKKSFANYLEQENVTAANHKTQLLIATVALLSDPAIKTIQLRKSTTKIVHNFIASYNPAYFDSFMAKQGKEPEEGEKKNAKTEKAEV